MRSPHRPIDPAKDDSGTPGDGTYVVDAGGDFSLDFVAADPFSYDHSTGGGAFDDRTIGTDVVESLEGGDFACGDIVTYLIQVSVDDTQSAEDDEPQTIELDFEFLADTTGQSGAAHSQVTDVAVNYGAVSGGDGPGGTDSGMLDDGGSTVTNVASSVTDLFDGGVLSLSFRLTDLERAEEVIVRIDTRLACQPFSRPTGNLQAALTDADVVFINGNVPVADAISGGEQTIPFKQFGNLLVATITIIKNAIPDSADLFPYTINPSLVDIDPNTGIGSTISAFNLEDDGVGTGNTRSFVVSPEPTGSSFLFTETPIPGDWDLTNIVCVTSTGSSATTSIPAGTANVTVFDGDTVTCTYTNELNGTVNVLKYEDEAADGDRQAGDALLGGWTVKAYAIGGTQQSPTYSPIDTQVTDANGEASFSLSAGLYLICENAQRTTPGSTGWTQSEPSNIDNECTAAGAGLAADGYRVTVTAGGTFPASGAYEFGNYKSGTKSGFKYEDENANGNLDALDDLKLSGWSIKAIRDDGDAEMEATDAVAANITSTTTDGSGNYSFTLAPGTYFVCESAQNGGSGWTQSSPQSGDTGYTAECGDADAPAGLAAAGYYVTITSQSSEINNEFGNYKSGTKSGFKYEDENANGNLDALDDLKLSGWSIKAIRDDGDAEMEATDAVAANITSTTTDGSGNYSFTLAPGTYFVCESAQNGGSGWTQSSPQSGDTGYTAECGDADAPAGLAAAGYYVTITSQSSEINNEFGNYKSGTKSGFKYEDENANGNLDALDDLKLSGWSIKAIRDDVTPRWRPPTRSRPTSPRRPPTARATTASRSPQAPTSSASPPRTAARVGRSPRRSRATPATPPSAVTPTPPRASPRPATTSPSRASRATSNNEFGNYKSGSKSGFKYEDENANGNLDAASTI